MGISVKQVSEMFGKDVFTNRGVYAGRVADVRLNLAKFRIHSVVVDVTRKLSIGRDRQQERSGNTLPVRGQRR